MRWRSPSAAATQMFLSSDMFNGSSAIAIACEGFIMEKRPEKGIGAKSCRRCRYFRADDERTARVGISG